MTTPPPPGDPQGRDDLPDDHSSEDEALTAPAPPPGVLDAARAAALAAFDEQHGADDDASPTGAPVGDLASARSRRWYERSPLGAVAAAIAAVALVGALTQIDTGGEDDLATAAGDDSAEIDDSGASAGGTDEAFSAPEAALEADDGGVPTEEGSTMLDQTAASYQDLDAFLAFVASRDQTAPAASPPRSSTTPPPSGDSAGGGASDDADTAAACDAVAVAGVDGVTDVEVGFVEDLGVAVAAVVYESETGARVAAVDLASCELLDDRAR